MRNRFTELSDLYFCEVDFATGTFVFTTKAFLRTDRVSPSTAYPLLLLLPEHHVIATMTCRRLRDQRRQSSLAHLVPALEGGEAAGEVDACGACA